MNFFIQHRSIVLSLIAHVYHHGSVATIVYNHCRTFTAGEVQCLECTPPVVGQCFTFPGKYRHAGCGNSGCGMVLGRVYIAGAPAHFGTQCYEGFNQYRCLDGHVQGTHDTSTFQRFCFSILFAKSHEAGHFLFCQIDFLATEVGKRNVCHLVGQSRE